MVIQVYPSLDTNLLFISSSSFYWHQSSNYSETSDKGPSEKGTTPLQRTLLQVPLP